MSNLTWKPISQVKVGDNVIGFHKKRMVSVETVQFVGTRAEEVFRVSTDRGSVVATGDHPWLNCNGKWVETNKLKPGRSRSRIRFLCPPVASTSDSEDYKAGYVSGLIGGDGCIGQSIQKGKFVCRWCSVRMIDIEPINRLVDFYKNFGIDAEVTVAKHNYKSKPYMMHRVEFRDLERITKVKELIAYRDSDDFAAGWLAGMFDAEGSLSGNIFRISQLDKNRPSTSISENQKDKPKKEDIVIAGKRLGFDFAVEQKGCFLKGGIEEIIRFFSICRPASSTKRLKLKSERLSSANLLSVTPEGVQEVFNLQTTSGNYWAAGLACHNCYYRPDDDFYSVKPLEKQLDEVRQAARWGCDSADLTGGEPLQNPHVVELIRFATENKIFTRIITSLICAEKTLDGVIEAGAADFLISMHGHKPETHNRIVEVPNARKFQIRRMAKIASIMRYCANYVLVEANQTEMADWARWITSLDHQPPKVVNFINYNPHFGADKKMYAQAVAQVVDYSIASPILDEAIDILEENGVGVNVRYAPMCCVAERHRKNVCNDLHVAFDQGEWLNSFATIKNDADKVYKTYSRPLCNGNEEKGSPCNTCSHQWICGGANKIWHKLAKEKFGREVLHPLPVLEGVAADDFWHYRKENYLGLDPRR